MTPSPANPPAAPTSHPDRETSAPPAHLSPALQGDLADIAAIASVPKILEIVCRTTGMGFAAVARVTDTHWTACAVKDNIAFGLKPGGQLDLRSTICDEIRCSGEAVIIDHVTEDPHWRNHHTPRQYGFQSYISIPIRRANGDFFGTLCAIDPKPAVLRNTHIVDMFFLFADLIGQHLDAQDRAATAELALVRERADAVFRDRFIAVLGHDLRNPLAAIRSGTDFLTLFDQTPDTADTLAVIQRSVDRMSDLIENVLDFARGRLGGGIQISRAPTADLYPALEQVITELRTSHATRSIAWYPLLPRTLRCDTARISQLLSNLLANALTHGHPAHKITVTATTDDAAFILTVHNFGPTIPDNIRSNLFQPFVRGSTSHGAQGLGLGLYIASEIAHAHSGTLTAASANNETTFTFQMPLA